MARKVKKNYRCNDCNSDIFFGTQEEMIAHYQKKHKMWPEGLFNAIGETWNPTITRILQTNQGERQRRIAAEARTEQMQKELAQHVANFDRIAAKWNAIVMIVSGPANK